MGQYLHQLSLVQSSRSIQRMQTVPRPKQVFCLFFREDQSLLHRSRNSGREYVDVQTPLWVTTYTSYLLYKVQDPFSACRQSHVQNRFFCLFFREDQSLLHRSRNSGREYVDVQTPLWVSTSTSYLLYKVQDPFSAYRQSHVQNRFFCLFFREDQSLLHRPRNSGRECAWWTNSLVGQYLHQLSLVQSSRSIQRMQTVPWPKQVFCLFFREDQSLLQRSRNSGRECAWWTNSLVGQYLHQLSLVRSSRSI